MRLHGEQAVTTLSQVVCPPLERGDHMIEGEIVMRAAILAGEAVAQEDVEPREGGNPRRLHIGLERHDAGQRNSKEGLRTTRSYSDTMLTRSRNTALIASCQLHSDSG